MSAFTVHTGAASATLTNALLAPACAITIKPGSIALHTSGQGALQFYDGSLPELAIGAGLLLTSGYAPGGANTVGWDGQDNSAQSGFNNGDADIDTVVNAVFQTQSYDATTLSFDFSATSPDATSISFDLVFGSEEYPEWVDQFVDCAVVLVNGVNYALFNHDAAHPLSVLGSNLAAGYFQDNSGNTLPIQYDGVSHLLKIVAPIKPGGAVNHIKIAIADTGDHIYDSGIFIANLAAGTIPGSGVVIAPPDACGDGDDHVSGSSKDEFFDLKGGDDSVYAGAGDDIVTAGAGNDALYGGSGDDELSGDAGDDSIDGGDGADTAVFAGASSAYTVSYQAASASYTISKPADSDTLKNVEFAQFSDGRFSLGPDGLTAAPGPAAAPANTPGVVAISGIGAAGHTLSATTSDPDGIAGAVAYQWQVSGDGGASWSALDGATGASHTLTQDEAGMQVQVLASYTDQDAHAELALSAAKTILGGGNGDLHVSLMQLTAPLGAGNINPLTTLVKNAIDLGLSANLAATYVKQVLELPAQIELYNYDALAALAGHPGDKSALAFEKVAVQVAILTSLSDDDSGMHLAEAIIAAAQAGKSINLASATHLAAIIGVPATLDPATGKYPQPLAEIWERNKTIAEAIADGGKLGVIESEWQDLLSIQDGIASTGISDLSIHVNQAPAGSAGALLAHGAAGADYTISAADLLQGFSDSDGGLLQVQDLSADQGGVLQAQPDGGWIFSPEPGFANAVELSYLVLDGQGGAVEAKQMFVIDAAVNHAPGGAVLLLGTPEQGQTLSADSGALADADGLGALHYQWLADGAPIGGATGASYLLTQAEVGKAISVALSYTDGLGTSESAGSAASAAVTALPGVTLTGTKSANTLHGGAGNDLLSGLGGNDTLDGGAGADTMSGGTGSDTYYVRDAGDLVQEGAGAGTDLVHSYLAAYTLGANVENGRIRGAAAADLNGNELDNKLYAGAGDNALNGAAGSDTVSYLYASKGVKVSLALSGAQATGGSGLDRLSGIENLSGSDYADQLSGDAGANLLGGGAGNDTLDGGAGADTMSGGSGADTYYVRDAGDLVQEGAGAGTDLVHSYLAAYTLGANVENGRIRGAAAADLNGNELDNNLYAGAGDNALNGAAGNDTASYLYAGKGVKVSLALSGAQATGGSGLDRLSGIENLSGSDYADQLSGDAGANLLGGGAGNDTLAGGAGNDILIGGTGKDILSGGAGNDLFRFLSLGEMGTSSTTRDVISDFVHGQDKIDLSGLDADTASAANDAFGALLASTAGFTAAGQLKLVKGILYGNTDADASAEFAITLTGTTALALDDFIL